MAVLAISLSSATQINAQTENSGVIVRVSIDGANTDYYPGRCGYGTANWGGAFTDELCGNASWGYDITPDSLGCDSIPAGQLTGKVAMIRRGTCSFSAKAFNAQKAGAVAVLIGQIQDAPNTDDCYVQAMGATTPFSTNTTIPVLFACRNMVNQIDAAIKAGKTVSVCFVKPDVDITSVFFPASHVQTPLTQIKTDTFGFGATLSNLSPTVSRTNIEVTAKVLKSDGTELFSASTVVPEFAPGVTDSFVVVPGSYVPDLPLGTYEIKYTTKADPVAGVEPVQDRLGGNFYVTQDLFANDNGATIGFRPSTAGDWGVGALYTIAPGTLENYQVSTAEFAFATNATDYPIADVAATVSLFKINDDVAEDYSNFDDAEFFSPSFEWLALGAYEAPANVTAYSMQQVTLDDINTGSGPVPVVAGGRYVVAAQYTAPTNLTFNAFNQNVDLPGVSTLVFSGTWFLGGFGAGTEAVMRMYLDLVNKTDDHPLADNTMNIVPNPVVDVLNLDITFDQPTNATITIADINGRVITYENRKGLTKDLLHYPLSVAAGTYLARIATENGTLTKKFVVVK